MKLSKKGLEKIQQWQSAVALGFPMHPSEINFEPDDFQDTVVLTVEEAKVIEELALLCLFLRPKAVTIEKAKVMKELNNRIKQAEKCNE